MKNKKFSILEDRALLRITGEDTRTFLQGLISNNVEKIAEKCSIYGALLTPQGKFLYDFFVSCIGNDLYLDCEAARIDEFCKRLKIYKLRSKVDITTTSKFQIIALYGDGTLKALRLPNAPGSTQKLKHGIIYTDPRISSIGARCLLTDRSNRLFEELGFVKANDNEYHSIRISLGLPNGSNDMDIKKSTLLECGFEELNGIDFDKGCYMGQELTARTKYRGLIKKRLMPVKFDGEDISPGTIIYQNGKNVGELRSVVDNQGIALIRLDALKIDEPLVADDSTILPTKPDWANY